jgi:3-methyl-2-oxobutanoate hydroxymethyltransferase
VAFNHRGDSRYRSPVSGQWRQGDDLEALLLESIRGARREILVAVQELSLPAVAQALVERHRRGVRVRVVLENLYSTPWSQQHPADLPPHQRQRQQQLASLGHGDAVAVLQRAGVPVLLVGDTAAEMVLGFERTIDMPLDLLLALTAAVKRGAPSTFVMGDMPFMSYHAGENQAVINAGRFLTEGRADIVKIEADESFADLVRKMTRAGIPVCGHIGSRPQQTALNAGYAAAGRTGDHARQIVADAVALEQAGAVMLLVEAVPDEVTDAILAATSVPLIGIGAGTRCHGQVLVLHDLLGLTDRPPRFAEPVASLGPALREAGAEWVRRVAARSIGGTRYSMRPGESLPPIPDAARR